uniref:Septation protein SpoVG n=1 Tax=Caenorhabditis tropicalis TaxID=1561998 RepID=A0A1I7TG12_9PELO
MSYHESASATSKGKSAENTDDDRTLAEDDQNDQNSGSMDHRFERVTVVIERTIGKKFGLGIVSVHQRIFVCKVENGQHTII